uniref:CAP-Gly domain-containing protein n=1 Tax=Branchiostoma floridae TaxID=7739 RepID=C3XYQ6_BRAFL|eukprot:XP_002610931.1 hypothetical protein BRAFLDRAFT_91528 [Branchiostoma floridae]
MEAVPVLLTCIGGRFDSCSDIKNLDEDKEIASSAVALVVRSTRRGIVPLCADIANLLRARKSLENMVAIQRQELNRLRHVPPPNSVNSSPQTSRSVSPLQTRVTSCRATSPTNSHDRGVQTQHRTRKKLPRQYSLPDMGDNLEKRPPTTKSRSLDDQLSVSSTEVQCDIPNSCEDEKLLKQYRETLRLNSKLVEDLTSARKEIESLKRQLAQQEKLALYEDTYRIEHELQQLQQGCDPIDMVQPDEYITLPTMPAADHLPKGINGSPASRVHSARPTPPPFSPPPDFRPLLGCKCTICYALQTYGQSAPQPTDGKNGCTTNSRKVLHRPKFHVQLNDHVVLRGDRTGLVRYIGHLDNVGAPAVIYVGIELDAPIGRHDGYVSGKRYFFCHRNHGVFVPIQDVICIINKQQPQANRRPHTVDVKRTSSGSSEMSSGSGQSQSSSGVESSSKTSFELQETSPKRNVRTPTSQLRGKNFHSASCVHLLDYTIKKMAFAAVGSFVLALLIGLVGGLTCYNCEKLDSASDFMTCLQDPFSVPTEECTGDEDTCQATLVNTGWLHVVVRHRSPLLQKRHMQRPDLFATHHDHTDNHDSDNNDDTTDDRPSDDKHISEYHSGAGGDGTGRRDERGSDRRMQRGRRRCATHGGWCHLLLPKAQKRKRKLCCRIPTYHNNKGNNQATDNTDNNRTANHHGNHRTPNHPGNHRTPNHPGNHRTPNHHGNHRTPNHPGNHRTTNHPGNHRTTNHPGNHRTPNNPGNHRTPNNPGNHRTPNNPGNHRTPNNPGNHRTPNHPGNHRAPKYHGNNTTPNHHGNHRTPNYPGNHRTTNHSGDHRTPNHHGNHRTLKYHGNNTTPNHHGNYRTPNHSGDNKTSNHPGDNKTCNHPGDNKTSNHPDIYDFHWQ